MNYRMDGWARRSMAMVVLSLWLGKMAILCELELVVLWKRVVSIYRQLESVHIGERGC
jgi:hypothetical protein